MEAAPEVNVSGSEAEDEREEPVTKVDGERDPDFSQVGHKPLTSVSLFVAYKSLRIECLSNGFVN